MSVSKCETCGGTMIYSINSEYAVCENCGNTAEADSNELARIRGVYKSAELKTCLNSIDGLKDAINQFQSISNTKEVPERIAYCENRLKEIKEKKENSTELKEQSDTKDKSIGIIVLIFVILIIAFAIAGAVYIIFHLIRGDLSTTATIIIVAVAIVSALLLIINNIKS
ncbi:MAG: hypothetical protein IJ643_03080 [Eubacterium sp.]|nr:hypothetical protein [Eubacterium sp.]